MSNKVGLCERKDCPDSCRPIDLGAEIGVDEGRLREWAMSELYCMGEDNGFEHVLACDICRNTQRGLEFLELLRKNQKRIDSIAFLDAIVAQTIIDKLRSLSAYQYVLLFQKNGESTIPMACSPSDVIDWIFTDDELRKKIIRYCRYTKPIDSIIFTRSNDKLFDYIRIFALKVSNVVRGIF